MLNKIDAISIEELDLLYRIPMSVPISSREWWNIDELIEKMWETLNLVRVYTKPRGLPPDYNSPVVLRRGKCTVEDFCNAIHKEIAKQMKYAIVWGASAKHSRGQKVGLEHVLEDEDGACGHAMILSWRSIDRRHPQLSTSRRSKRSVMLQCSAYCCSPT